MLGRALTHLCLFYNRWGPPAVKNVIMYGCSIFKLQLLQHILQLNYSVDQSSSYNNIVGCTEIT